MPVPGKTKLINRSERKRNIELRVTGPSIADFGFRILDWKKMDCKLRGARSELRLAGIWFLGPDPSMHLINSAFINILYDCSFSFICSSASLISR